jgi:hypothetical protein
MSGKQRSGDLFLIVLDENIASEDLQAALTPVARAAGARVDLHTTHFPRETKDPVWMPIAAEQRWAVISCDVSVKKRPAEKEILMNAGVCMYILRGTLNGDQIRDALVKALPAISVGKPDGLNARVTASPACVVATGPRPRRLSMICWTSGSSPAPSTNAISGSAGGSSRSCARTSAHGLQPGMKKQTSAASPGPRPWTAACRPRR